MLPRQVACHKVRGAVAGKRETPKSYASHAADRVGFAGPLCLLLLGKALGSRVLVGHCALRSEGRIRGPLGSCTIRFFIAPLLGRLLSVRAVLLLCDTRELANLSNNNNNILMNNCALRVGISARTRHT